MAEPAEKTFLDLTDANLVALAAGSVPGEYRAGVVENLRILREHASRVAAALPAGGVAPEAFEP